MNKLHSLTVVSVFVVSTLALGACSQMSAYKPPLETETSTQQAAPPAFSPHLVANAREFFFPHADKLVVAAPELAQPAAGFAVAQGMPMVIGTDLAAVEVAGIKELVTYGGVDTAGFTGNVVPAEIPGPPAPPAPDTPDTPPGPPALPAPLDPYAAIQQLADQRTSATSEVTALVTPATPLSEVATARAAGAKILLLTVGDPRENSQAMEAVAAGNTVALGPDFGTEEDFTAKVALAANGELPGGGGLVFPGRRMVALYGHPSGGALGALGEQDPLAAVERVKGLATQYQELTGEPVIPAFEIIATVASGGPGADGDFSNETDPADLIPYIDAITRAGGYAVLDLQPGRASLLAQAQIYTDLLKRPNVGLALDPEWKIGPDEVPMNRIGHVEAAEINEVSQWLSQLVRDNKLPQKAFVLHQFQLQMIRNREALDLNHPELAFVLHADGNGTPALKMATWNALRQGLDPRFFMAWKNFFDEDSPMFSPVDTFSVDPRPWFVSYQ